MPNSLICVTAHALTLCAVETVINDALNEFMDIYVFELRFVTGSQNVMLNLKVTMMNIVNSIVWVKSFSEV